jgi:hypothetical protein
MFAEEVFGQKDRYAYGELVELMQQQLDIKERTAKSYIRFMRDHEIIIRHAEDLLFRLI